MGSCACKARTLLGPHAGPKIHYFKKIIREKLIRNSMSIRKHSCIPSITFHNNFLSNEKFFVVYLFIKWRNGERQPGRQYICGLLQYASGHNGQGWAGTGSGNPADISTRVAVLHILSMTLSTKVRQETPWHSCKHSPVNTVSQPAAELAGTKLSSINNVAWIQILFFKKSRNQFCLKTHTYFRARYNTQNTDTLD